MERTVEISGKDADRFIDTLTCRDLTTCAVKQGKYMIVTAPDGGIVNDPVLLHVGRTGGGCSSPTPTRDCTRSAWRRCRTWTSRCRIPTPTRCRCRARRQRRRSRLVGAAVYDLKYYWCDWFDVEDIPVLISRTGWTAVQGFEINLLDPGRGDDLWNAVFEAGEEFGIRPVAPVEARRIEAGIMNYNSDMTTRTRRCTSRGSSTWWRISRRTTSARRPSRPSKRRASIASSSGSSGRATS